MAYHGLLLIICLLLTSGCSTVERDPLKEGSREMADIYLKSMKDAKEDVGQYVANQLKEHQTFGYVKPYVPVIEPPMVKKVWVPDHKSEEDGNMLIAGHWVYLMIQGPRWFIEDETQENIQPIVVPGKVEKGNVNAKD